MNSENNTGFLELQHTADWAVRVWATDVPSLLVQSARAMFEMTGTTLDKSFEIERTIELAADDDESLLVAFLSELLYLQDTENIGFDTIDLSVTGFELQGRLRGSKILSRTKEIKAVTYHNLEIKKTPQRLEVTVVFDV